MDATGRLRATGTSNRPTNCTHNQGDRVGFCNQPLHLDFSRGRRQRSAHAPAPENRLSLSAYATLVMLPMLPTTWLLTLLVSPHTRVPRPFTKSTEEPVLGDR